MSKRYMLICLVFSLFIILSTGCSQSSEVKLTSKNKIKPIVWDTENIYAYCPYCNNEINLESDICKRCNRKFKIIPLPLPETIRNAFIRFKSALIYNNEILLRDAMTGKSYEIIKDVLPTGTRENIRKFTLENFKIHQIGSNRAVIIPTGEAEKEQQSIYVTKEEDRWRLDFFYTFCKKLGLDAEKTNPKELKEIWTKKMEKMRKSSQ